MSELSRHQRDALDRVSAALAGDARVVGVGIPGGFGRHQTLACLAAAHPGRSALVVGHPTLIDLAFGCLSEAGASARSGLLASGSEIEVGTVQRAHGLARDGRLSADLLLVDALPDRLAPLAHEILDLCPDARAVTVREPPESPAGTDPGDFHFPVDVLDVLIPQGPSPPAGAVP